MIKTNISIERLMKLNPSVKTREQAEKILHDVKTKPSVSLNDFIAKKRLS